MGPEAMMFSALLSGASTALGAVGQASAMKAQAAADQQRAEIEGQWAQRRATEERAAAQRAAAARSREAQLAQSKLVAAAGYGASDPTAMDLFGDIEKEGRYNAATETAAGEQKAAGMQYQAALDRWTADTNAAIKKSAAKSTLIGGLLGAAGQTVGGMSRMAVRYSEPSSSYRYG
jgi:hypothetical protein